jgi:copper transport protein
MRRSARIPVATALAAVAAVVCPAAADAHARLVRAEPPDAAVLAGAPRQVRLWFSEPVVRALSSAWLTGLDNGTRTELQVRTRAGDVPQLVIALPQVPRGTYALSWRVLSRDDGHVEHGLLAYGVGQRADPHAAAAIEDDGNGVTLRPLDVAARWLILAALTALAGAIAVAAFVGQGISGAAFRRRAVVLAGWSAALGVLAGVVLLLTQAAQLGGLGTTGALLTRTRFGTLWLAQEAILLAGAIVLLLRRRHRDSGRLWAAGALAAGAAAVHALGSHAAAIGSASATAVAVDTLHLLAAGTWAGGLLALVVGLWPARRDRQRPSRELVTLCLRRFARLALWSGCVLAVTGVYALGLQVASLDALLTTAYGGALLVKIGLLCAAGAVGLVTVALARRSPLPRPGRVVALLALETAIALLALLAVATVTSLAPARGPEFTSEGVGVPSTLTRTSDDLLLTLSAKPNQPGRNLFTLLAATTRRPPPGRIVGVRMSLRAAGVAGVTKSMREIEPGRYAVVADVPQPGSWQIDAIVQRTGSTSRSAAFAWAIGPERTLGVTVSDRRLRPLLSPLSAAAAIGLLLVAISLLVRRHIRPRGGPARTRLAVRDSIERI